MNSDGSPRPSSRSEAMVVEGQRDHCCSKANGSAHGQALAVGARRRRNEEGPHCMCQSDCRCISGSHSPRKGTRQGVHRQAHENCEILFSHLFMYSHLFSAHLDLPLQNLLQVCERIPTIGTQLKILSTVKATMLGAQGELLCPCVFPFVSALSSWVLGFHRGIQFSRDFLLSALYDKLKSWLER